MGTGALTRWIGRGRRCLSALAHASIGLYPVAAQIIDEDALRRIELPDRPGMIAGIIPVGDGRTVALSMSKGGGVLLVDTATWSVVRALPASGFHDGARLTASSDGRFLHMAEQYRYANLGRKDLKGRHVVLDLGTGAEMIAEDAAVDGVMDAAGRYLVTLRGEEVTVHAIIGPGARRTFNVPGATNALAVTPDGRYLAVSHRPSEELLLSVPSVRNDRKAIKNALKFRQMVSIHALEDGRRITTVPEIYDIIRAMAFSPAGDRLLVYSTTDLKLAPDIGARPFDFNHVDQAGHVDQVAVEGWAPLRASCMSRMSEPSLAVSPDGALLALSSTEGRNKRKLQLYETATGDTRLLIDLEQKHASDKGEGEQHDGRLAYCWTSDGRLLIGQGDHIGIYRP